MEGVASPDMSPLSANEGVASPDTSPFVLLPVTSDSKRFLYLGKPDEHGEYPVFVVLADEGPEVILEYPGLDVALAVWFGLVPITMTGYADIGAHPDYTAAWDQQAKMNLPTGGLAYDELLSD